VPEAIAMFEHAEKSLLLLSSAEGGLGFRVLLIFNGFSSNFLRSLPRHHLPSKIPTARSKMNLNMSPQKTSRFELRSPKFEFSLNLNFEHKPA